MSASLALAQLQPAALAGQTSLSAQDASAVYSTLTALYPSPSSSPTTSFSPTALALHPPSHPPPPAAQAFLHSLVLAAQQTAVSVSCGSVLAGTGSEGDECGDVGVWVGELDLAGGGAEAKEVGERVVQALALDAWKGAQVIPRPSSPAQLPIPWPSADPHASTQLRDLLAKLSDPVVFALESGPDGDGGGGGGGEVPLFMLGRHAGGWCGLVSVAVWS